MKKVTKFQVFLKYKKKRIPSNYQKDSEIKILYIMAVTLFTDCTCKVPNYQDKRINIIIEAFVHKAVEYNKFAGISVGVI